MTDGLYHLQVTYQYESGIDVYAADRRVRTIGGPGRVVINDDDNIYSRNIVVSQEDYGDTNVYERIVMTADGFNANVELAPEVLCVTAQDGGTLTREFSMDLFNGIADRVDDLDGDVNAPEGYNVPPTGDVDITNVYLIDGTEFKVTIERVRGPRS